MPPFFLNVWNEYEHTFERTIIIHSFDYTLFFLSNISFKDSTNKYSSSHLRHIIKTITTTL